MPQIIPLQAIPNQQLQVQLGTQPCTITVQQFAFGLFLSLYIGPTLILSNVLCENLVKIVRDAYLGFSGDLFFLDTQGNDNPDYTGLGSANARYLLYYYTPTDLANLTGT